MVAGQRQFPGTRSSIHHLWSHRGGQLRPLRVEAASLVPSTSRATTVADTTATIRATRSRLRYDAGVSTSNLLALPVIILCTYGALLAAFFGASFIVLRLNALKGAYKIQARRESAEQMRRDLRQSLRSLMLIAAMFGGGYWAYERMGWGLRAANPSGVSIGLSFVVSMLLFDTWFYWLHRLIHSRWLFRR